MKTIQGIFFVLIVAELMDLFIEFFVLSNHVATTCQAVNERKYSSYNVLNGMQYDS